MLPLTPVIKVLVIVNVVVFALVALADGTAQFANLSDLLALYYPTADQFAAYQLVTHFFMHASVTHLLMNMLGLYFLGPIVETRLGGQRFLTLYLLAAAGAVLLHFAYIWWQVQGAESELAAFVADPSLQLLNDFFRGVPLDGLQENGRSVSSIVGNLQNQMAMGEPSADVTTSAATLMRSYVVYLQSTPMVGASGAISGVVAAFAVFFPKEKLQLLFIPIGVPAAYMIGFFFLVDLVLGVLNLGFDNIAHFAHIGGAVTGAVLAFVWKKTTTPPWMRRIDGAA